MPCGPLFHSHFRELVQNNQIKSSATLFTYVFITLVFALQYQTPSLLFFTGRPFLSKPRGLDVRVWEGLRGIKSPD